MVAVHSYTVRMAKEPDNTIVRRGSPRRRPKSDLSTPLDARSAAIAVIIGHASRFPDLLPSEPETNGLEPRDAALAHAIQDAVVRRWLTLIAVLRPHLQQPFEGLEPRMKAILLCGAAQIVFLDRIPPHAAVSESVAWAKRRIRPGAGGLVNAVLRRVHESIIGECVWTDQCDQILRADGRALQLNRPVLPEEPIERLSVQVSCPVGLLRRWAGAVGARVFRKEAGPAVVSPPIVLNVGYTSEEVPATSPHANAGHAVFDGSMAALRTMLANRDDVWVQDAASGHAIRRASREIQPKFIVDACAGRGTKTRQLAAAFPEALIVATDVDAARLKVLRSVFQNHDRVQVVAAKDLVLTVAGKADLVLLDVPCSNSGVLARRPEAKYRFSKRQLRRLAEIQQQIIADAIPLLAPQGAILYSTCSLETEEDTAPLDWAEQWHGFTPRWTQLQWPDGGSIARTDEDPAGPSQYFDGSFAALLTR